MKIKIIQKIIDKIRKKNRKVPPYTPLVEESCFVNIDKKPISSEIYKAKSDCFKNDKKLTIVMQGPIMYKYDFTLETIKIYLKTFPNCPIILSTWDTENLEYLKKFENLGVSVLKNSIPEINGLWNVNYQIKSTISGLQKAKANGAEYVIKTRTDQRFYETNIKEYLFNLLEMFPLEKGICQNKRLITLSMNTFKYRLYDISDMFLFGYIDDVIKYWDTPYETREIFPSWTTLLEYCKLLPSEIGFCVKYIEKIGHKCEFSLRDSWECYRKYFCVIDASSLRLYWPKYTTNAFRWRNFIGENELLEELTFKEWLSLYQNNLKVIPEDILNKFYK